VSREQASGNRLRGGILAFANLGSPIITKRLAYFSSCAQIRYFLFLPVNVMIFFSIIRLPLVSFIRNHVHSSSFMCQIRQQRQNLQYSCLPRFISSILVWSMQGGISYNVVHSFSDVRHAEPTCCISLVTSDSPFSHFSFM
jgi:hypothetical protein